MNMNPNELESAWNSPRNNFPTDEQQRLAEGFARQMIRRRRFQSLWLINTFAWLTIITVVAMGAIAAGKVTPAQEWSLFPLLLVPWGFAIVFLRRYLKPAAPVAGGEAAVVESLRAALASNQQTRAHLKLVGVLYIIMVPLLAVSMHQLQVAGKVSPRELTSMGVFFGGVLALCGAGVVARYFGRLRPQQRQLEELVRSAEQG
jgi:hypothetical protein